MDKRSISTFLSVRLINPLAKAAARAGLPLPGLVILETAGRKSGQPRRTPVGKALDGDTLWIVRRARPPRRLCSQHRGRPRAGSRRPPLARGHGPGAGRYDPRECQRTMPRGNAQVVRLMGSQLLNRPRGLEPGELCATATG